MIASSSPSALCYEPERASHFFSALERLQQEGDAREFYIMLRRVFVRLLHLHTQESPAKLVGVFAQTDYLLKKYKARKDLRQAVNDVRVRMRKVDRGEESPERWQHFMPQDVQAVSWLVALIYGEEIPPSLVAGFPKRRVKPTVGAKQTAVLRVIVEKWESPWLYARAEDSGERVCVDYVRRVDDSMEGTYLEEMLREGMQLNLIEPREVEGHLRATYIIVEPDYLIDVSAIANCFEPTHVSPYTHLLNRLKPYAQTEAILLGAFASQVLDEALHRPAEALNYSESIKRFFRQNALSVLQAHVQPSFHEKARQQLENVQRIVREDLPRVEAFCASDIVIEPSFICEKLGLQGRMDMLQMNGEIVVEQKSGKGGFPDIAPDVPRQQQKHYVQMLLYMAVLRYGLGHRHEQGEQQLSAFLLYSKYRKGLLGLGFASTLLFEALRLRNQIVALELEYTQGGLSVLTEMTPQWLNPKGGGNKLWDNFLRPNIEATLRPIHQVSQTERSYYLRMLTFLQMELYLAKVGNQRKENSGFAAKWHDTLEEKRQAGNIYENLSLISPQKQHQGSVEEVSLALPADVPFETSNFRKGDIVLLYPYEAGHIPDVRKQVVLRCSIIEITAERLTLKLRAAQSSTHFFDRYRHQRWAVEHDMLESSHGSLFRGVHSFLSAPRERRQLWCLERSPRVDSTLRLQGSYGNFDELALRVKQAQELFLIIGPPGTGKTSYGLLTTLREELLNEASSVLLAAFTNRAVDEICSKLTAKGIDFVRIGNAYSCAPAYHPYLLETVMGDVSHVEQLKQRICSCRVFVGTTSAFNQHTALFELKTFQLAIIDEASQLLEPHLVGLFAATQGSQPAIRKFVLIGDHKQLPAIVAQSPSQSQVQEECLHRMGLTDCRLSLFERMLRCYQDDASVVYMLRHQGRMHEEIAAFPNQAFYKGQLRVVPLAHQQEPLPRLSLSVTRWQSLVHRHRLAFFSVVPPKVSPTDKVNPTEAKLITHLVHAVYSWCEKDFSPAHTLGIIVPYRNQIATLRSMIAELQIAPLNDIAIDTVERFQGSQCDYIIYGFTAQEHHQLRFLTETTFREEGNWIDRKLNVAMTRARLHLLLVGNAPLLAKAEVFANLIAYAQQQACFYEIEGELE